MTNAKIKKFWVAAAITNIVVLTIAGIVTLTFGILEPEIMKDVYISAFIKGIFGGTLIGIVAFIAFGLILYFRSYKKLHTGLLTFIVVCGVINIPKQLHTIYQYLQLKNSVYATQIPKFLFYFGVFGTMLLLLVLAGYFWIFSCAMLRRMNFEEKGNIIEGKEVYVPALVALKEAGSLEVLKTSFEKSKKEYSEIAWYLKRVFKKKKKELK